MTRIDAEKLLGGYATATLTEAERTMLLTAALEHQELFDALLEEEALRELLADPVAKAQLIAALAPAAASGVRPLWRRMGMLGAAAGVLVAATAGLALLRSPEQAPPPLQQESPKPSVAQSQMSPEPEAVKKVRAVQPAERKAVAAPLPAPTPVVVDREVAGAIGGTPASRPEELNRVRAQAEAARAVAHDYLAKRAAAPELTSARALRPAETATTPVPTWSLEPQADGSTRILILAPTGSPVTLLRRGPSGPLVVPLRGGAAGAGPLAAWRADVRLEAGAVLDLYLLNSPAADPARLPETGPVDGFRARIYPAER